jgi:hypothetical protein
MGWASYNKFGLAVDEKLIRAVADSLVTTGMRDAGYATYTVNDWTAGGTEGFAHFLGRRLSFRLPQCKWCLLNLNHHLGICRSAAAHR